MTPIAAPSAEDLRAALRRLAALTPDHKILARMDRDGMRWIYQSQPDLDRHIARMVTELPDDAPADDAEALLDWLYRTPRDDMPVRFYLGATTSALVVEHACIDGLSINEVWPAILAAALDGGVPTALATPSTKAPLIRALDNYYRRSPKRVLTTLRTPSAAPQPRADGSPVAWHPGFAVVSARSGPGVLADIKKWRLANARGTTRTMVLFAAVPAAFTLAGVRPAPGAFVPADNRRFLRKGSKVIGNFAPAVFIQPDDPTDPAQLNEALERAYGGGRPLAAAALVAATAQARRRKAAAEPDVILEPAQPVLALVHTGRLTPFERLPWLGDPAERRYLIGSTPGDPDGVSVFISEIHKGIDVTATFHGTAFDVETMRRIVTAIAAQPTAALDAYRSGT